MKLRIAVIAALAAILSVLVVPVAPAAVQAQPAAATPLAVPVTGTIGNLAGTFAGTFTPTRFAVQNGQLVAIGTLTGTLTDATGAVIGSVAGVPLTLPVIGSSATCPILHLTLGPLDLNLLGLVVHLNQVVLTIDAQSGPGNLLGNLLCAVAHLLDGGVALNGVANLLNQVLARL
jgi:hypothetical protein